MESEIKFSEDYFDAIFNGRKLDSNISYLLIYIDNLPKERIKIFEEFCMNDPKYKLMYLKAKL